MRVFISWSGERSHSVAIALKNFIGDIIQSVTPFVSDDDIISGERWNSRIQEELQENQYGILSITRDNKESPWLLFEAGALSNSSHNIPVVPFLFDIEPSELTGSPLLQFQTIYYNKENVKKLINDINNACGENNLDNIRLERAFERCYGEFESALKQVKLESDEPVSVESDKTHAILEELLDLTRGNQKLLSSDNQVTNIFERIESLTQRLDIHLSKNADSSRWRGKRKFTLMTLGDLFRFIRHENFPVHGLLIPLSIYREDLPWIYDAGKDLIDIIKSDVSLEKKRRSMHEFEELVEFTLHNPIFSIKSDKEEVMILREFPMMLSEYLERHLK